MKVILVGGPYHGSCVWMRYLRTLPMRYNGFIGEYIRRDRGSRRAFWDICRLINYQVK